MPYLRLLGGARIESDGEVVSGRAAQKHRLAILALLAAAPGRALPRERIIDLVWPHKEEERGRHLLSVAVYEIRKELGEEVLVSRGDDVVLDAGHLPTDLDGFEAALEAGDPERALGLWGGPFLDGFGLRGSVELEQWIDSTRERYAALHRRALERVARGRGADGDAVGAVDAWRELASVDPFNGRVALGLVRALQAAGNRAGALQFAREYERRLREELDAEPDGEFQRMTATLRDRDAATAEAASPSEAPPPPPLPSPPPRRAADPGRRRVGWLGRWTRRVVHSPRWRSALLITAAAGLAAGILAPRIWGVLVEDEAPPYVVVLPLQPVDSADAAWADGLTEQLMDALASVSGLQVAVRSAAFALRGAAPAEALGRLDADLALTGVVRRAADRVSVRLELSGSDGRVRWSRSYHRSEEETVRIESWQEIATGVRAQLSEALGTEPSAVTRMAGAEEGEASYADRGGRTMDPAAFELYSKGREAWFSRSPDGFARALQYFSAALARDSTYARALVGLADGYNLMGGYDYGILPPDSAFPRARAAAERALALAPEYHEAWAALAHTLFVYDWNWEAADSAYRTALRLNPRYAQGRHRYSLYLVAMGRTEEAMEQARLAHELDSQSPVYTAAMARQHYFQRDFPTAADYYRQAVDADPGFFHPRLGLALTLLALDRPRDAEAELRQALDLVGGHHPLPLTFLYAARTQAGETAAAGRGLEHLGRLRDQGVYVPRVYEAILHIAGGDLDEAMDALEDAYEDNSTAMAYLNVHPIAHPLQGHPRFRALAARVGLPGDAGE